MMQCPVCGKYSVSYSYYGCGYKCVACGYAPTIVYSNRGELHVGNPIHDHMGNWNRGGDAPYTQSEALNNSNFENLARGVQNIENRQYEQANNLTKGLADGFYGTLSAINGEGRALQAQIADCCCNNRLATAQLSAQLDQQTASITTAIHAEGEQTRALIQTNEIQALRDKVSALEADNRMCGVVRYPMSYAYSAGPSPFCNAGGCGCGNNV